MKKRNIVSVFTIVLVIIGLLAACADPTKLDQNQTNNGSDPKKPDPSKPSSNYTVKFEANGGSPAPAQQTIAQGGKVTMPSSITKIGYGFGGWYKEAACTNLWNFDTDTVSSNITLYAKWDTNYHTVNFEANGGSPAPAQQTIAYGSKIAPPSNMNKNGYTFDGWYKDLTLSNLWDFSSDIVLSNTTLYAKWLENFTVTFETNGENQEPIQQIIANGHRVLEPPVITNDNLYFDGWYKEETFINLWNFDSDVVNKNIILYAKWINAVLISGGSFGVKMRWLEQNVQSNNDYIIEFNSDESINPTTISYSGKNNIRLTLKSNGTKKIISANSSMFTIESGVILILNNLKIQRLGESWSSNYPIITVNSGGNLILNNGTTIIGNSGGLGVYVNSNGTFTMNDGEISGNSTTNTRDSTYYGGGVYVKGTFIMNGGKIFDNSSKGSTYKTTFNTFYYDSSGGGVYVDNEGEFTMNGGEISGNVSSYSDGNTYGGGVYVSGTFIMNSGEIADNNVVSSPSYGGGVCTIGIFTMSGGKISGNTASSPPNYSDLSYGGGVYVSGTFTMSGGEISANIASSYGGGVYLDGNLNKTGGTIYGYTDGNINSNVVKDSSGVVLQNRGHAIHINSSNSIYIMGKNTTSGTADKLSFNSTVDPPAWSGNWDY